MSPHHFHIPVMGTGFTIDTPLHVAQWGVSSVISLVDDQLIEQVRAHHTRRLGLEFDPIRANQPDARARRITAYLDFLHDVVAAQVRRIRNSPFGTDSEIDRYFAMLPEGPLTEEYRWLSWMWPRAARRGVERRLRNAVVPGSIDANIMTKIDRRTGPHGELRAAEDSDALAALRGFARAKGEGAIVFSAGLNPRLFAYAAQFGCFRPDATGRLKKRIVLKISDYRSAAIQGRYLAKRGLWVSEYRLESGLNCGGHAFATPGVVMGPILREFAEGKAALVERLFAEYTDALNEVGSPVPAAAPSVRVTAQGGIGTAEEDRLLREGYGVDGTGWGSPFLLVRDVTRVDAATRAGLLRARPSEIRRGSTSPLGVPFWSLTTSHSDAARRQRIERRRPGSACPKGYLALEEPSEGPPMCSASRAHHRRAGSRGDGPGLDKACLCHELGGGALIELGIDVKATPAVCPGPNIVNFRQTPSLSEMVDHIYGRHSLSLSPQRPHMFVSELDLYVEELEQRLEDAGACPSPRATKQLTKFRENMAAAVEHYRRWIDCLPSTRQPAFERGLARVRRRLDALAGAADTRVSA